MRRRQKHDTVKNTLVDVEQTQKKKIATMKKTATPQSNDLLDFLNTPVQQPTRPLQQQQQQPVWNNMQPHQQPTYPATNNFYQQPAPVQPYQQQYFSQPQAMASTNPFDVPFTAPVVAPQKPKSTNPFDDWTAPPTTAPLVAATPKPVPTFVAQQPLVQQQPKPQPPALLSQPAIVPKAAPQVVAAPSKPVVAQQPPVVAKPAPTTANLHPVPAKKPAADEQGGKETVVKESDAPAWEDTWKKTSKDMDWMQKKSEQDTEFKNITTGSFAPMKQTTNWKKK